jgi:hypothetical protein
MWFAGLLAVLALANPPSPSPRLLVSLHKRAPGTIAAAVENAAPRPLAITARTYLTLLRRKEGAPEDPLYWAEIEATRLPSRSAPAQFKPRERIEVSLDLGRLTWAASRDLEVAKPLSRAVPPGDYSLQLQVFDESGNAWQSASLPVTVTRSGALRP